NALEQNVYTRAWQSISKTLGRPSAVVAVSAHWYLPGTRVTAMEQPRTIHDFAGFPRELYEVSYPAPGEPALARRLAQLLQPLQVQLDEEWGLDHGTWSVLKHVFPAADVPVIQLSIDATQAPAFHHEVGQRLAPLRDEGVLVIGSGNVVHNLRTYAWRRRVIEPYDWAVRFDALVRQALASGDQRTLIEYQELGEDARLSVPSPEHYLPLLYVLGLRSAGEPVAFPTQGIEGGSISMLSVQIG
ncbi:MAG TPA: 4,5-DOPA dioxygenase extradiol, partial [Steroidobacteraceae bacterium]|nr:4,5-DOPA dioxygenase extradiol [Steroidobacteraceae bacterium]